MLEALEVACNVPRYGQVNGAIVVIPLEGDAVVYRAVIIHCACI